MATPPTTTAATTLSSELMPALASSVPKRAAYRTPANPASAPLTTNAPKMRRPTGIPLSRAAAGSEPIAYSSRPLRNARR